LAKGATLDFHLGSQPSPWGKDSKQAPPSFDSIEP